MSEVKPLSDEELAHLREDLEDLYEVSVSVTLRLIATIDAARKQLGFEEHAYDTLLADWNTVRAERDAALARAEKAEERLDQLNKAMTRVAELPYCDQHRTALRSMGWSEYTEYQKRLGCPMCAVEREERADKYR